MSNQTLKVTAAPAVQAARAGYTPLPDRAVGANVVDAPDRYVLVKLSDAAEPETTSEVKESRAQPTLSLSSHRGGASMGYIGVPALTTTIVCNHTFRFICGLTGSGGVRASWTDLFYLLSFQATSTTAFPLISSLRLKRVTAYYQNSASTLANSGTFLMYWNYLHSGGKAITKAPRSMGALGNKCTLIPPKNSLIGLWHTPNDDSIAATDTVFYIDMDSSTGSAEPALSVIVDVNIDFTIVDGDHGNSFGQSTTGTNVTGYGTGGLLGGAGTGYFCKPYGYQTGP